MRFAVVLGLIVVLGCGDQQPERPATVTPAMAESIERYVVAFEKLTSDVTAPGTTCHGVLDVVKRDAAEFRASESSSPRDALKQLATKDPAARDWLKATYEARVASASGRLGTLVALCKDDPTLRVAVNVMLAQFAMFRAKH
ncbi:hypothetical protein BH11MYX3_BH11MYX3_35420 [soil metagenome]